MTTIEAKDLKVGDTFTQTGSSRSYTVEEVTEAHRSEYSAVLRVKSSKGTIATVAFAHGVKVVVK